ncbi:MAG: DUF3326 domain-containing protein [Cyanobacteria bacterium]|nr:DUF3326 domain-containing protein [Cyanobacteria bacterium CG_2015-16_32_12]NCO76966.1 DUF3326 domain-containing protein [Cyanobacteria bacterium CG_2015-22_32_23]NCQ03260.1 DUF3326 domain-containing protein [Cyanobacteria bacterium CG_2015-09_32_10]NCQ42953.1 DUF3326 domain-containing protein [Cyanobacteria bacterium CG_2015-04_32_10]NCS85050.1 DUF3326 domain-containing protein [Cyanobacteria bacterium CG_2015-02_32_10]
MTQKPYSAVLIIPTGIGASIGGYAGDALPVAKAMAQICDRLITHPNVMNGASLYWQCPNIDYVEGYALDKFAGGEWGLESVTQNKIGLILDKSIETELIYRHLQATDAVRTTLGINVQEYIITDEPLNVELRMAESGTSWGTIGNPESLLRAGEKLISNGINALAVVTRFPDDSDSQALEDYRHGSGVDALGGAEAVISHLLVREFQIPCAHAPALSPLPLDVSVSPRSAAEELGYTFLPCVLVGLNKAPQFTLNQNYHTLWAKDIDTLVIPASAGGGSGMLSFSGLNTQIIAVEDNKTVLNIPPELLGMKVIRVKSYLEALGVMVTHRAGIRYDALNSSIKSIKSRN